MYSKVIPTEIQAPELEVWADVKGYEGLYQISTLGRVKSFHSTCNRYKPGRLMNPHNSAGYAGVVLHDCTGKRYATYTHRLIATAFIPNPDNKPHVNHKDANKLNNDISNLEWCTHQENVTHAVSLGLFAKNGKYLRKSTHERIAIVKRLFSSGMTTKDIAAKLGIYNCQVCIILKYGRLRADKKSII